MHKCCTSIPPPRPTPLRRLLSFAQWAAPITTLILIPKCPACLAADVMLLTGAGLTLPAAAAVRWTLIALCAVSLLLLAARALRRRVTVR